MNPAAPQGPALLSLGRPEHRQWPVKLPGKKCRSDAQPHARCIETSDNTKTASNMKQQKQVPLVTMNLHKKKLEAMLEVVRSPAKL